MIEVHWSDGVRHALTIPNVIGAKMKAKQLIENVPGLQWVSLYKYGVMNTTDKSYLLAWWGHNCYWYNRAKKDHTLHEKELTPEKLDL